MGPYKQNGYAMYDVKFCPQCGTRMEEKEAFGRARPVCPNCGLIFFRDLKVAVGALITNGRDRVLLVRRAVRPEKGKWALPAGYMEYEEEPIQALRREVAEETGLDVEPQRVLDVFPLHNPYARGVIVIYAAHVRGPVPETLAPDDDVDAVRWFTQDEIPWESLAFESTRRVLKRWVEERKAQDAGRKT